MIRTSRSPLWSLDVQPIISADSDAIFQCRGGHAKGCCFVNVIIIDNILVCRVIITYIMQDKKITEGDK